MFDFGVNFGFVMVVFWSRSLERVWQPALLKQSWVKLEQYKLNL